MRINKFIAASGLCSRRKADELIEGGKVFVDGVKVSDFSLQVDENSLVEVDGQRLKLPNRPPVYIMLNKPVGYITSASDDLGRPTVFDLIGDMEDRLFPVGRLDYNTSGLLLLTNDGEFSNLMMHPKNEIYKTYIARVKGEVGQYKLNILRKGVIVDGRRTAPAIAEVLRHGSNSTVLEIKIHEGRNRQIRKMCEAIGCPVIELHRSAVGNLTLGHLKVGHYKKVNPKDIEGLKRLALK